LKNTSTKHNKNVVNQKLEHVDDINFRKNLAFCYIDDVLLLNKSRFGDSVDHIYPIELEIKDMTDTDRSASYLDLHLKLTVRGG
jgi:hypothetical protein